MLDRFHRIAVRLLPLRKYLMTGIVIFFSLGAVGLFYFSNDSQQLVFPGIAGALWCGLLYAFIELFQVMPPAPRSSDGYFLRLSLRIKRAFLSALAWLVVIISLMLVWLSLRIISL